MIHLPCLLRYGVVARLAGLTVTSLILHQWTGDLAPEAVWWLEEGSFVGVDGRAFPNQIGGCGLLELGLLEDLPECECDNCQKLSHS